MFPTKIQIVFTTSLHAVNPSHGWPTLDDPAGALPAGAFFAPLPTSTPYPLSSSSWHS